jgi:osmoprotectant transport system substrate-binding protein
VVRFLSFWRTRAVIGLIALIILASAVFAGCTNTNGIHLVVGGKLDIEAQLLTKMYVLLLRHAGFDVVEKAATGGNDVVFNAIRSGQINIYPEFTTDGLARLGLSATHNLKQDVNNLELGYESRYHITWLDVAPKLNDTYGICTLKSLASQLNISSISQLARIAPQLTLATPPDGQSDPNVIPRLKPVYGITFGKITTIAEEQSFQNVIQGQAQLNICYTTSPLIAQNNFVLLSDDKHAFPDYYPAPIVRDDVLNNAPQIRGILNPLGSRLTSEVSIMLQAQVIAGFTVTQVATTWLESQGLL